MVIMTLIFNKAGRQAGSKLQKLLTHWAHMQFYFKRYPDTYVNSVSKHLAVHFLHACLIVMRFKTIFL